MGFIKLDRGLVESEIWDTEEPFCRRAAWIDLLMLANFRERNFISKGELLHLKAGEMITSIRILSERWYWSIDKVRLYLNQLEKMGMIEQNRSPKGTRIYLKNWQKYNAVSNTDHNTDPNTDQYTDPNTDPILHNNVQELKEGRRSARTRRANSAEFKQLLDNFCKEVSDGKRDMDTGETF